MYLKPSWRAAAAAMPAPLLSLSVPTKTALTALAGASIALPSSLPFAIFSLDFGKEGAAVLSSILQVVGSLSALAFLKSFPDILRSRGWFGVHALLALLGLLASISMGTVMFADSQKFSRRRLCTSRPRVGRGHRRETRDGRRLAAASPPRHRRFGPGAPLHTRGRPSTPGGAA